jgi:outer membrane protein assembly factor BamD
MNELSPHPDSTPTPKSRLRVTVTLVVAVLIALNGCSLFGDKDEDDAPENWPEDKLYLAAKEALDVGSCHGAIEHYQRLQTRYPFGPYAAQAQLELAYCYYKSEDSPAALASVDRFLQLNPTHPHMDYAYYLRGLINFNIGRGLTTRIIGRDPSQRDPGAALRSFKDFAGLVQEFPKSRYVDDAELRMRHLRNILAQHEVNVANFYMRVGAFVAAANRARNVVENFQQTPAMPEALVLLAKSYKVLEMNELSDDALRVLELNYPNHPGISEVNKTAVR